MIFTQAPILVITRPKKIGFGTHWGVQLPNGVVVDYTETHGLRFTTADGFADASDVAIVSSVPSYMNPAIYERLNLVKLNRQKYDLLNWNCETFAKWLTEGNPKSDQIIGLVIFASVAGLAVAASR